MAELRGALDLHAGKPDPANGYFAWKRFFSLLLAVPLAILMTPAIAGLWALVRLTSKGPGFYSQIRLGEGRKPFQILKLCTMRVNAEVHTGPVWATQNDPRITMVGRFLRKYHLDELPQIYNVVLGHMSLVGPRPERPQIAENLAEQIPGYFVRNTIKPGITGMAQLHLDADESVDSVCSKLGFDLAYIERASPWLDLKVFLGTCLKMAPGLSGLSIRIARCGQFLPDARNRGAAATNAMLGVRRSVLRQAGMPAPNSVPQR